MTDTAPETPAPRRRTRWLLVALLTTLVLSGGGAGAFWWWSARASAAGGAATAAEPAPSGSAIVPLQPFLVNLADRDAPRFLRITVSLVVGGPHEVETLEEDPVRLARARSAILELLTTLRSDVLVTPEGKQALKASIAERAAAALHVGIHDVLFTDFVVQF